VAPALTALQFSFALTWILYVIYLPALAAQAGIEPRFIVWILAMDQAIFIACDWAAGAQADRIARLVGRFGVPMAAVAIGSCVAFVAMPWVAPAMGAAGFLAVTAVWSATSSALRAPPMALVSRHVPEARRPWIAGIYLLGLGLAAAIAPYLGLALKGVDPRIPFAAASVALAVFVVLLAQAERRFEKPAAEATAPGPALPFARILIAVLLFAIGYQAHIALNSPPTFLRLSSPERLPHLLAVFWIGFNLAVLPASILAKRRGGTITLVAGGAIGVLGLFAWSQVAMLEALVAAQVVIGAAWASILTGAFTLATEAGRGGREGLLTGIIFSILAGAAFARFLIAVTGMAGMLPLTLVPLVAWAAAAALIAPVALRPRPAS
jgi:Major Facilitator Superfamily